MAQHDDERKDALDQVDAGDLIWGAEAIGGEIGRSESQVYHLLHEGVLGDAVKKIGHRTIVGSKRRLRNLFFQT